MIYYYRKRERARERERMMGTVREVWKRETLSRRLPAECLPASICFWCSEAASDRKHPYGVKSPSVRFNLTDSLLYAFTAHVQYARACVCLCIRI